MIEPQKDILACGEEGLGKMSAPQDIFDKITNFFDNQNILANKNIVITAGATHEPIDPVRFIGNKSSGKQALYIAQKLSEMGADLTIIAGNISQQINFPVKSVISINSAQEMLKAVDDSLKSFKKIDAFIGCSAVADYRVKNYSSHKIKKSSQPSLTLELERNPDILHHVGTNLNRPKLVIGFCAESENLLLNAQQKLISKNCDLIIANDIENGKIFGDEQTQGFIVDKNGHRDFSKISKIQLAEILGNLISSLLK
ncbi:MAG: bifunctional phosphopantothenoylcysteine decarboxylase/phosphopantothenate--cysteine ligase CoaBC [Proteobacteria bacterium]|nr:bifunctional phosphopantothenoylcysteine decarboxylase/phosphopantothenate--cysteine ligase CoaBC [Pseudomonadota bacterium]NCA27800.1 bifunctional phosphopantothenoylcysteine decarboxylase/phosphopantothenate--cysteine ligase CoaBC [Pseudomonadota bacterium]